MAAPAGPVGTPRLHRAASPSLCVACGVDVMVRCRAITSGLGGSGGTGGAGGSGWTAGLFASKNKVWRDARV